LVEHLENLKNGRCGVKVLSEDVAEQLVAAEDAPEVNGGWSPKSGAEDSGKMDLRKLFS
jgi:hypothetical protein